ncbi:DnaJ 1 [Babesia gibsoni]|uniref:DnaJ 1 n=1 Tax=Babesia gibsoni TaxID=33632 RepID=A0AAD8PDK0_BABGI|nr:DnaJ 1 [Babesia gibsoni]
MSKVRTRFEAKSLFATLLVLYLLSVHFIKCKKDYACISNQLFTSESIIGASLMLSLVEGKVAKGIQGRKRTWLICLLLGHLATVSTAALNLSNNGRVSSFNLPQAELHRGTCIQSNRRCSLGSAFVSAPASYETGFRSVSYAGNDMFPAGTSNKTGNGVRTFKQVTSYEGLYSGLGTNAKSMRTYVLRAHSNQDDSEINYYKVLSLPEDCSEEDIKAKHEEIKESLKSLPSVEKRIKQTIKEAYKVLSNPASRAMYDQKLKGMAQEATGTDYSDEVTDEESDEQGEIEFFSEPDDDGDIEITIQDSSKQKRGGLTGFLGDLFGFNREPVKNEMSEFRKGDIFTNLEVELKDLVFGGKVSVNLDKFVRCQNCNASKKAQSEYLTSCVKCKGRGMLSKSQRTPFGYISTTRSCMSCNGRGISRIKDCDNCSNTGRVHENSTVSLDLPSGTKVGSTFRVKGKGHSGGYFSSSGDLYVKVVSDQNNREYIKNDKVFTSVDVDYVLAILGGNIGINTFCGPKEITIAPGSQHGDEVLIGNYDGMKHLAKINITVPKTPSEEEISLLRNISEHRK